MKTNIARHDPAHCACPGLFLSVKKGERKKRKIEYLHGKRHFVFKCFDQLSADDLRALLALVSLANEQQTIIAPATSTLHGKALRKALALKNDAKLENAIVVKCSYQQIFDELGRAGGGAQISALHNCIDRLFNVSISLTGSKKAGSHLLAEYESDKHSLHVALNPLIAEAISGGRYCSINMDEVRLIKSDAALLIYQRLCSFIDPSKASRIALETLSGYVWEDVTKDKNLAKYRRKTLLAALTELRSLGWRIVEVNAGMFRIERPKIGNITTQR